MAGMGIGRQGQATIAIVEDEADLRLAVEEYLTSHGYNVVTAASAQAYRDRTASSRVDIAVLDIAMPGESGLSLARWIRSHGDAGIIFATASDKPIDRIVGIETGADDYIVKPYALRELFARIKGLLRRMGEREERPAATLAPSRDLAFGGYRLDLGRRTLKREGTLVALTGAEFDLLAALAARAGRVLSRSQIAGLIGSESDNDRAVDTAVTRLRKKIEADAAAPRIIKTVRGEGYMLSDGRS